MFFRTTKILFALVSISFLYSCSSNVSKKSSEYIIFPPPPDTAKIQFLTKFSNSIDVIGEQSSLMKYVAGDEKGDPIIKPYGVRIYKGKIYICDTILGGLIIIDLETRTFRYFQPTGFGTIKKPINIDIDPKGNIYVADSERREVIIFGPDLKYKGKLGDAKKLKPTDVFYYNNEIYVTNIIQNSIEIYSADNFEFLRSIPDYDDEDPGFLNSPTNLFIKDDTLFVSDFGAFKIKIFTLDGKFVRSVGSYGRGTGQFVRPKGIAVDNEHNLYVVDSGFENVQLFDKAGNLLMFFGGTYNGPGDMWLPAKVYIDYDNTEYFEDLVAPGFKLKYLILVTNQYGPDKIGVYGFIEEDK